MGRWESGHQLGKAYKVAMNKKIGKVMIAEGIDPIYALDWNLQKSLIHLDHPRPLKTFYWVLVRFPQLLT